MCKNSSYVQLENQTNLMCFNIISFALPDKMVAENPVFNQDDYCFNTEEEEFSRSMERSVNYVKCMKELKNDNFLERHFFKAYAMA